MKKILFLATLMMSFYACDTSLVLDLDKSAKLGEPFRLKFGKTVEIDGTLLQLVFNNVEESRCPKGTNCVRAGEGKVSLKAMHAGETENLVLEVKGLCDDSQGPCGEIKNFRGYDIELTSLSPYPKEGEKPAETSYSIRMKVTKGRM